jgi:hypothetical protein
MRRLLTLGPDNEPLWARLYVNSVGEHWAAMRVGDAVPPPRLSPSIRQYANLTYFLPQDFVLSEHSSLNCVAMK